MQTLIVGCGYLGLRVAGAWIADGHSVSAMTRSRERAAAFEQWSIQPTVGDVTDPQALSQLPSADVLLYAVGFDRTAAHSKRSVYVDGLRNVLQSVRGRVGHFIYVSSTSVYGQRNGEWVDERSPCQPVSENGQICLDAEQLVRDAFTDDETTASILRFAGIYGPNRLLRRVEALASADPIGGNPDAWLNLIHVDDGVATVHAVADRSSADSTWLVSDGNPIRRRDFFTRLARLSNAPPPVFDPNAAGARSSATGLNKRCRNDRVRHELGVTLRFSSSESGLRQAIAATER